METPVTTPEVDATVATPGALLLQVPPEVALVNQIVEPDATVLGPLMEAVVGKGLTNISAVAAAVPQPLVTV
jgi:hypothetical protein